MTEVECPICDWSLDLTEGQEDTGLLGALGIVPTGLSRESIEKAEIELVNHLESHTTIEWVKAMRMADIYIEQLEGERDKAFTDAQGFAQQIQALKQQLEQVRSSVRMQPQMPMAPPLPNADFGAQWEAMSPRERQEQLRADRKAGISRQIPDSLIPFISPDKRAEGVVGRRR